jgi:hypothetical protein
MSANDFISWLQTTRNIYYGEVLDSNDPLMLGRIRVHPKQENYEAMKNASPDFDENANNNTNGKWSDKDPFIFLPLLPYYINQIPQEKERVLIIYYNNSKQKIQDRYYIVGPYSSPVATISPYGETYNSSRTHLMEGSKNDRSRWPNIKKPNGDYNNISNKGVFAEPTDISIKGRGTTDLILKNNDVLLRAGKHQIDPNPENKIPIFQPKRAFLQLSKYETKVNIGDEETFFRLESDERQLRYLIEYDVYNPESNPNPPTVAKFRGNVTIYQLPSTEQRATKIKSFEYDTTGFSSSKLTIIDTSNDPKTLDEFAKFVSDVIVNFVNKPNLYLSNSSSGTTTINANNDTTGIQFPFYYRPSQNIRNILKSTPSASSIDIASYSNMQKLISKIQLSTTDLSPGYSLVLDAKLSTEIPFIPRKEKVRKITTEQVDNSVGLLGANYLYLLSNETSIPGKAPIKFEEFEPSDKIEKKDIDDKIVLNTSSMVRGEELLDLLESIVGFLVSHVHPYPLLPPSSVAYDGTSTDDLLKKMLEAYNKVLNKNIRLN